MCAIAAQSFRQLFVFWSTANEKGTRLLLGQAKVKRFGSHSHSEHRDSGDAFAFAHCELVKHQMPDQVDGPTVFLIATRRHKCPNKHVHIL